MVARSTKAAACRVNASSSHSLERKAAQKATDSSLRQTKMNMPAMPLSIVCPGGPGLDMSVSLTHGDQVDLPGLQKRHPRRYRSKQHSSTEITEPSETRRLRATKDDTGLIKHGNALLPGLTFNLALFKQPGSPSPEVGAFLGVCRLEMSLRISISAARGMA